MESLIFNVPSVISQSCMKYTDGDDGFGYDLEETEINYFYALLYLYREKLLEQTDDLLIKGENGKSKFDESVECEPVTFALKEFSEMWVDEDKKSCGVKDRKLCGIKNKNDCGDEDRKDCSVKDRKNCGVVTISQYEDIRPFFNKLKEMSIVLNVLRKDKDMPYTEIRMVESLSWVKMKKSEPYFTLNFTKEFRKLIMLPEQLFKKVDLKTVFTLRGKNQKLLYLLFKDYSRDEDNKRFYKGVKKFGRTDFEKLFGYVPQKIEGISKNIQSKTELMIDCVTTGIGITKNYIFTIINNEITKKPEKKTKQPKKEIEIIDGVWEICKIRLEEQKVLKKKRREKKIDDEGKYLMTIYTEYLAELSKAQIEIYKFIDQYKKEVEYDASPSKIPYLAIFEDVDDDDLPIHINDEFQLITYTGPMTNTPEETMEKINEMKGNDGIVGSFSYSNLHEEKSKTCLKTTEELRYDGIIR
jgi:hypothetical protein